MIKRILASITALALTAGIFPIAYADDPSAGTGTTTAEPEVTVVGKRITGDNTYFEISLEVNGDYEDYSSVGVVLQYDPTLIVPAASWDDDAAAADMTESTSWATRRALPTLGKDTWTTHTALTYIEETTDVATGTTTQTGYLYLGAEYPGVLPNNNPDPNITPDPNATPDPSATATPEPTAAPTATPEVTPDPSDPYCNPVVVARFMYANDTAKAKIENDWTAAWDADWTKNKILTIAPNDISDASPAQFGFAYYKADFTMKGFMFDDATATTAPGATAEPSFLDPSEKADKSDIEIVFTEGKSAKAGGLSLSDIYVTLFYDWDDSLLGSFTCGVGVDSSADINEYVKAKFIHPDLQGNTNYTSNERVDNYRGEYPSAGPNGSNPTLPGGAGSYPETVDVPGATPMPAPNRGSAYPLTNKLDYCFAGRDFNTDDGGNALPFVGGWTKVTPATMEDTWTALSKTDNFAQTVDADGDGVADTDTDGDPIDVNGDKIDMVSYNFADVQSIDLDGGVLYVKAVYTPGYGLDYANIAYYSAIGPVKYGTIGTATATTATYSISYQYKRISSSGYGVTRIRKPALNMALTQVGASASTPLAVLLNNGETIDVDMTPTNAVSTVGYQLRETYGTNIILGGTRSIGDEFDGLFKIKGGDGIEFKVNAASVLQLAYDYGHGVKAPTTWVPATTWALLKISQDTNGTAITKAAKIKKAQTALINLVKNAESGGHDYTTLTWYQMQYAVLNSGAYVENSVAEAYCELYPALMAKINE